MEFTDFTVRIRFRIPSRDRIGIDESRVAFAREVEPDVILKTGDDSIYDADDKISTIRNSDWLVLQSSGWRSKEEAKAAVEPLTDALRMTLARFNMGADLGNRSPKAAFFRTGLEVIAEKLQRPTLNDRHGAMVFPTELKPILARAGQVSAFRTIQGDKLSRTFSFALSCRKPLSERERTAFDLFSVAHGIDQSEEARFVLLFAAIETLLEDVPRPTAVVEHVDRLVALTSSADLDECEKASLLGSLQWMRSHSIRSSGRRLIRDRLGGRAYDERPAENLFLDCYEMRSRILHGSQPFPSREEISRLLGPMDIMLGDLLCGPALDFDPAT